MPVNWKAPTKAILSVDGRTATYTPPVGSPQDIRIVPISDPLNGSESAERLAMVDKSIALESGGILDFEGERFTIGQIKTDDFGAKVIVLARS